MKAVLLQLGVLAALFWALCTLETAPRATRPAFPVAAEWRRTVNGWEPRSEWPSQQPVHPAARRWNVEAVHPLNLAALQALLSIGALLLLTPSDAAKS